jgi:hypothetical protein
MKKTIIGGLSAGGLMLGAAGLVLGAGLARANTYGDINDHDADAYALTLDADGWLGTPSQARGMAIAVCSNRMKGASERALTDQLAKTYSTNLAVDMVDDAEFHFCPAYEMKSDGVTPLWVRNPNWGTGGWAPNDPSIIGAIPSAGPVTKVGSIGYAERDGGQRQAALR